MLYQLSYSRLAFLGLTTLARLLVLVESQYVHTERVLRGWWMLDLNQRRLAPADLQSAPFSHSGNPP